MLSFTRKTDYALIALAHIVHKNNRCCSAREIATHYGMPIPLLMNVLKSLHHAGLARSERGPRGGYQLAQDPKEITLCEIVEAVNGPFTLTRCQEEPDPTLSVDAKYGNCELSGKCPVRSQVHVVYERMVSFLKNCTLADITGESVCPDEVNNTTEPGVSENEVAHLS